MRTERQFASSEVYCLLFWVQPMLNVSKYKICRQYTSYLYFRKFMNDISWVTESVIDNEFVSFMLFWWISIRRRRFWKTCRGTAPPFWRICNKYNQKLKSWRRKWPGLTPCYRAHRQGPRLVPSFHQKLYLHQNILEFLYLGFDNFNDS